MLLLFQSCSNENCQEDTVCTLIFVAVGANVVSTEGEGVLLDRTETIDENGEIVLMRQGDPMNEFYSVLTDAEIDLVSEEGSTFVFKGWLNNEEVVNETYIIDKDCCHIGLVEGKELIQLNL